MNPDDDTQHFEITDVCFPIGDVHEIGKDFSDSVLRGSRWFLMESSGFGTSWNTEADSFGGASRNHEHSTWTRDRLRSPAGFSEMFSSTTRWAGHRAHYTLRKIALRSTIQPARQFRVRSADREDPRRALTSRRQRSSSHTRNSCSLFVTIHDPRSTIRSPQDGPSPDSRTPIASRGRDRDDDRRSDLDIEDDVLGARTVVRVASRANSGCTKGGRREKERKRERNREKRKRERVTSADAKARHASSPADWSTVRLSVDPTPETRLVFVERVCRLRRLSLGDGGWFAGAEGGTARAVRLRQVNRTEALVALATCHSALFRYAVEARRAWKNWPDGTRWINPGMGDVFFIEKSSRLTIFVSWSIPSSSPIVNAMRSAMLEQR